MSVHRRMPQATSLVENQGEYTSKCGYCKSGGETAVAHGVYAHMLTVEDYQNLVDRGWRRSGKFLYKPSVEKSCCPPYSIRLPATEFLPSKEQRKVLKRMQRYLEGSLSGDVAKTEFEITSVSSVMDDEEEPSCSERNGKQSSSQHSRKRNPTLLETSELSSVKQSLETTLSSAISSLVRKLALPCLDIQALSRLKLAPEKVKNNLKVATGDEILTSSAAFPIAATVKKRDGQGAEDYSNPHKVCETLAKYTKDSLKDDDVKLEWKNGHLNFFVQVSQNLRGTRSVETDSGLTLMNAPDRVPVVPTKGLEITTTRSRFDYEEFELYRKYQTRVHNDDETSVTRTSYTRFLVDTPLVHVRSTTTPCGGFGSYHQQYRIDGRLVAVGVVDILPHCLSSKYLFWDPDFAFLSLGKYSALQEIEWVRSAVEGGNQQLAYYYLGYYIHSCPKMKYKAQYSPSFLLCPLRFQWFPYDDVARFLETSTVVVFSKPPNADVTDDASAEGQFRLTAQEEASEELALREAMDGVVVTIGEHLVNLGTLLAMGVLPQESVKKIREETEEYGRKVGVQVLAQARYVLNPSYLSLG